MNRMKMSGSSKKYLMIGGSIVASLIIIGIFSLMLRSFLKDSSYKRYYDEAQRQYDNGRYLQATESLSKALEVDDRPEAYLLLAKSYEAAENLDRAIEVLYIGSYKHSDTDIAAKLEELKAKKNSTVREKVEIGGQSVPLDTVTLMLDKKMLTDIGSLAVLTMLERLTLTDNSISDISPLTELRALTYLHLSDNAISDLMPLAGLKSLHSLYLDGNPIKDLTPLYGLDSLVTLSIRGIPLKSEQLEELREELPNCSVLSDTAEDAPVELSLGGVTFKSDVTELDLAGRGITDISELAKCTQLTKLDLRDNSISDVSPLQELTGLKWLCIWNNNISDLTPLAGLTALNYIDADGNKIKSASPLAGMSALEELWLSYNSSVKPVQLGRLTHLKRLGLRGNNLVDTDLDALMSMTWLQELNLEDNPELSGEKLDELKAALKNCAVSHSEAYYTVEFGGTTYRSDLSELLLDNVGVTDISKLVRFTKLTTLVLSGNSISDISALKNIKTLHTLNLSGNPLSDLSPLSGLTELRSLNITNTSPAGLAAIAGLTGLTSLELDYTGVSDISALAGMHNLNMLGLEGNNISDITPLMQLQALRMLYIGNNSITVEQLQQLREALPDCTIHSELNEENNA